MSLLSGQTRVPRIGDSAPPLTLGEIVQGHTIQTRARPILIEFWYSACAPCISSLPHWNALVDEFQDHIDFLSVNVIDDAVTVRGFLQKHPIEGVVALEGNPKLGEAYGIEGIPTTILLSRYKKVAAIGHPLNITPEVVKQLIAGEPIDLPANDGTATIAVPKRHALTTATPPTDDRALARVTIIPTVNQGVAAWSASQFETSGSDLTSLLSFAYDIPAGSVDIPAALAEERYELQAWVPDDAPETLKPLVQAALAAAAAIVVRRQEQVLDGFVLSGFPGKVTPLNDPGQFGFACDAHHIHGNGVTAAMLRECLENKTNQPVVLADASADIYNFDIHWDSVPDLQATLKSDLGLSLEPVRRPFEVLVVKAKQPPRSRAH